MRRSLRGPTGAGRTVSRRRASPTSRPTCSSAGAPTSRSSTASTASSWCSTRTWLPGFLWRFAKFWRGLRTEVPWVDRSPAEIVRDHFRLTIQPLDAPPDEVERAVDHLRSDDMLLYASDFPHWQFDGEEVLPPGIPEGLRRKILVENPIATYNRI